MSNHYPVGIFDSGIGGLSVLKELQLILPNERYIYFADSANAPYGDKSEAFIQQRTLSVAKFLINKPVKALLIACNTATASAISILREKYTLPIIGLEPAIKPAVLQSNSAVIGVMATTQTLVSDKYRQLKAHHQGNATIIDIACSGLVEYIEANQQGSAEFYQLLTSYLQSLQSHHIDKLVLGCTHYPFVKNTIQKVLSPDIDIIDSGKAVAEELRRQLQQQNLLNNGKSGERIFYSTKIDNNLFSRLWGSPVNVQLVNI